MPQGKMRNVAGNANERRVRLVPARNRDSHCDRRPASRQPRCTADMSLTGALLINPVGLCPFNPHRTSPVCPG